MARYFRPPFIALTLFGTAWLISMGMELASFIPTPWNAAGWAIVLLGVALPGAALFRFNRAGTPHDPYAHPEALVVAGPYRFTRNPMYLGVTLVLLGLAVWFGTWPYFLAPPLFMLTIRLAFIPREERRLEATFGQAYLDYKARVRRWI